MRKCSRGNKSAAAEISANLVAKQINLFKFFPAIVVYFIFIYFSLADEMSQVAGWLAFIAPTNGSHGIKKNGAKRVLQLGVCSMAHTHSRSGGLLFGPVCSSARKKHPNSKSPNNNVGY